MRVEGIEDDVLFLATLNVVFRLSACEYGERERERAGLILVLRYRPPRGASISRKPGFEALLPFSSWQAKRQIAVISASRSTTRNPEMIFLELNLDISGCPSVVRSTRTLNQLL